MKKSCVFGCLLGVTVLGTAQAMPVPSSGTNEYQVVTAPISVQATEQLASGDWVNWVNLGTRVLGTFLDSMRSGKSASQDDGEVIDSERSPELEEEPSVGSDTSADRSHERERASTSGKRREKNETWQERYADASAYSDSDLWETPYRYVLHDPALKQAVAVVDIPRGWLVEGRAWPINAQGDYKWAYSVVSADGNTWAYFRQSPDQPIASITGSLSKLSQKQVVKALEQYREEMAGVYAGQCQEIDYSSNTYDVYEVESLKEDYQATMQDVVDVRRLGYRQGYSLSLEDRDIFAFLQGPFDLVERKVKGKSVVEIYSLDGLGYVYSELDVKPRFLKQVEKLNSRLCAGYSGTLKNWNKSRRLAAEQKTLKVNEAAAYLPQQMLSFVERLQRGRCFFFTNSRTGSMFSSPEIGSKDAVWFDKNDNVVIANRDVNLRDVQGLENGSWVRGEEESQ